MQKTVLEQSTILVPCWGYVKKSSVLFLIGFQHSHPCKIVSNKDPVQICKQKKPKVKKPDIRMKDPELSAILEKVLNMPTKRCKKPA